MDVLLKTEKILLAGCVENTVIAYAGFSTTCLNMVCGNLNTEEIFNTTSFVHRPSILSLDF